MKNKLPSNITNKNNYGAKFTENNNGNDIIILFDDDGNKIMKASYDTIGTYNHQKSLWTWGWAIQQINKNSIKKSLLIKSLNRDSSKNNNNGIYTNGASKMANDKVEYLAKTMMYTAKGLWFMTINHENNIDEYIMINKIIQMG